MNRQLGGVEYVFRGPLYQQGYGLGGYFRKFFRWLVPIAEKHVLPHLKSGASVIGKQALDSFADIAKDTVQGRNIKESFQERSNQAIDNLKEKANKNLSGNGKRKLSRKIIFKKRIKDIFN
jgi:hypothetical protein